MAAFLRASAPSVPHLGKSALLGATQCKATTVVCACKLLSVEDIVSGDTDVHGWTVRLKCSNEKLGNVHEILPIGIQGEIYQHLMSVLHNSSTLVLPTRYLIPLVDAIVQEIDSKKRCLFVSPPDGLLELGRRPEKLSRLKRALREYYTSKAPEEFEASAITRGEGYMPTRSQLVADGRHDLVDAIRNAGGFLSVACALNLRACRRPDGYWENLRNLDDEIEKFIDDCWKKIEHEGTTYYKNEVTDEICQQLPPVRNSENALTLRSTMPRQKTVIAARKWDLHHAVRMHGGYTLVSQDLGRHFNIRPRTFSNFVLDMKAFMQEHHLTYFPLKKELEAAGREDLLHSVRTFGGFRTAAENAGILARPSKKCGSCD